MMTMRDGGGGVGEKTAPHDLTATQALLTIGIPTWNRSQFLSRLLDQVVSQVEGSHLPHVEILVNDNASDDGTPEMMAAYTKRHPSVRYARNAANLRLAGNVAKIVEGARGEYLWFISDDDLVEPDAVETVLGLARRGEKTIFFLNTKLLTGQLQYYRGVPEGDTYFGLGDEVPRDHLCDMGLISNLVAPTAEMQRTAAKHTPFNKVWPHLDLAFLTAITQGCRLCIQNRAVTVNAEGDNLVYFGTDALRVFIEGYFDLVCDLERRSGTRFGSLRYAGVQRQVLVSGYLSSAFSGAYWEDLTYVARLNRKVRSAKLVVLSLPFLLPRPLRRLLLFFCAAATGKGAAYEEARRKAAARPAGKSARRVTSDGNL